MTPKIDYALLGRAHSHYEDMGFKYVEAPWVVDEEFIRATLPAEFESLEIGVDYGDVGLGAYYGTGGNLVGSAEQSLLSMALPEGRHFAITPCFRIEPVKSLFYQEMFMKLELFDNRPEGTVDEMIGEAYAYFREEIPAKLDAALKRVVTPIGLDIELAGTEIGSYGERSHHDYGRWVYGTGLALPRFSVARSLAHVL